MTNLKSEGFGTRLSVLSHGSFFSPGSGIVVSTIEMMAKPKSQDMGVTFIISSCCSLVSFRRGTIVSTIDKIAKLKSEGTGSAFSVNYPGGCLRLRASDLTTREEWIRALDAMAM